MFCCYYYHSSPPYHYRCHRKKLWIHTVINLTKNPRLYPLFTLSAVRQTLYNAIPPPLSIVQPSDKNLCHCFNSPLNIYHIHTNFFLQTPHLFCHIYHYFLKRILSCYFPWSLNHHSKSITLYSLLISTYTYIHMLTTISAPIHHRKHCTYYVEFIFTWLIFHMNYLHFTPFNF